MGELVVFEYMPFDDGFRLRTRGKRAIKAKPASHRDEAKLHPFLTYLAKGIDSDAGTSKVAVVRWGPIEMYLTLREPKNLKPEPGFGLILHA